MRGCVAQNGRAFVSSDAYLVKLHARLINFSSKDTVHACELVDEPEHCLGALGSFLAQVEGARCGVIHRTEAATALVMTTSNLDTLYCVKVQQGERGDMKEGLPSTRRKKRIQGQKGAAYSNKQTL